MVRRRRYLQGLAGIGAIALAGCAGDDDGGSDDGGDDGNGGGDDGSDDGTTTDDTDEEIVVGASMSMSGNFATNGVHVGNAYELWAQTVNENGGIDGRTVRLELQDDRSETETAVTAVQRIIEQEDADAILGPFGSGHSAAVMGVVEEVGVPMLAPMASSPSIFTADNNWSFMGYPMAGTGWDPSAAVLADNGASTAAVLRTEVAVHEIEAGGLKESLDSEGIEHQTWTNEFGAEDLSTQISEIRGYDPDAVYLITYGGTTIAALREMINRDFSPDALSGVTTGGENVLETFGENINGVMGHSPWSSNIETEQAQQTTDAYIREFGMNPTFHFALGYASGQAYQGAVEGAGTAEPEAVRDYLANNAVEGTLAGRFEVNDRYQQVGYDWLMSQWQGGEKAILHPADRATTEEVIWPKPEWGF